jgi:OOP family OmpA-OmpF porin
MNMKQKLLGFTLATSLLAAGSASAFDNKFYVGGEVDWNSPKFFTVDTNLSTGVEPKRNRLGAGLFAGLKFHENFAAEFGYNFVRRSKGDSPRGNEVSLKLQNFYIDALGFWPVSPEVDLIASLGAGRLKPSLDVINETITTGDVNKAKFKPRVGLGAQYKFDENLATRIMLRYQKGNSALVDRNISAGLGLVWTI